MVLEERITDTLYCGVLLSNQKFIHNKLVRFKPSDRTVNGNGIDGARDQRTERRGGRIGD